MGSKITQRDNGAAALLRRVERARKGVGVTVGVHAEEGAAPHGDDTTVLDVASFHEFGTEHMEGRAPIVGWFDTNEPRHRRKLRVIADGVATGRTADVAQALDAFGVEGVTELRDHMAHVTAIEEGDPTPLDDTGKLKAAVTHRMKQ